MRKVFALFLACALLAVIPSMGFSEELNNLFQNVPWFVSGSEDTDLNNDAAESTSIQFLNIPWLSSVSTVKHTVANKITKDLPTGEFKVQDWTAPAYGDNYDGCVSDIPIYTLTYEGRSYYRVADFNVASLTVKFVPNAKNGVYSNVNFDDYAFVEANYMFDSDAVHDCKDIFNELMKKLSSLYGNPTDHYDDNDYELYYTLNAEGYVWNNADHCFLELRWAKMSSSFTGTMEHVYLNYAFADEEYMISKQQATAVSDGQSNVDVGSTDGL